jgi:hypothetical protein
MEGCCVLSFIFHIVLIYMFTYEYEFDKQLCKIRRAERLHVRKYVLSSALRVVAPKYKDHVF